MEWVTSQSQNLIGDERSDTEKEMIYNNRSKAMPY